MGKKMKEKNKKCKISKNKLDEYVRTIPGTPETFQNSLPQQK